MTTFGRLAMALLIGSASVSAGAADSGAAALRARQASLAGALAASPFGEPVVLDSHESDHDASGDVHALVAYPFAQVASGLRNAGNWCEILILHLNTKHCRVDKGAAGTQLAMYVGGKNWQELRQANRIDLAFQVIENTRDYLQVELLADKGPLSTHHYRIVLEAIPAGDGRAFLHMHYSYEFGMLGHLAMHAYLGTVGLGKVGFTRTPQGNFIGGIRGVLERNTMRYYLAIDAWLSAPGENADARLARWHAGTQRYKSQLFDLERDVYLEMKRRELQRLRAAT